MTDRVTDMNVFHSSENQNVSGLNFTDFCHGGSTIHLQLRGTQSLGSFLTQADQRLVALYLSVHHPTDSEASQKFGIT